MGTQAIGRREPGREPDRIRVGVLMAYRMGAETFAATLRAEDDLEVVDATSRPPEFLTSLRDTRPDVVVVDFQLPAGAVFEVLSHASIRRGRVRALVISDAQLPNQIADARALGAAGFVPKSAQVAEVVTAIRVVSGGGTCFPTQDQPVEPYVSAPSRRELELLDALRSGGSNAEIAKDLGISVRTVESHLRRMFARYSMFSRAEMLMLALRHGWVQLNSAPTQAGELTSVADQSQLISDTPQQSSARDLPRGHTR